MNIQRHYIEIGANPSQGLQEFQYVKLLGGIQGNLPLLNFGDVLGCIQNMGSSSFVFQINGSSDNGQTDLYDVSPPPLPTTGSALATGGHLLAGTTYYYVVTATTAAGESLPSPEVSYTPPAGTNTNQITLTWTQPTGATGYKVYRGTATGGELLLATIGSGATVTYADTSATVPAGALPTFNSAGGHPVQFINAGNTVTTLTINPGGEADFYIPHANLLAFLQFVTTLGSRGMIGLVYWHGVMEIRNQSGTP